MILSEILAPERSLTATARFRDTFKAVRQRHPELDKALADFLQCRLAGSSPCGIKDRPFTNRLRGFWHYHLVHGRVILIYQIDSAELKLYCITDHSYSTRHGEATLNAFLRSPVHAFSKLNSGAATPQLTASQVSAVRNLFFELAADHKIFRETVKSLSDLMDYVRLVINRPDWSDAETDAAAFDAFGGKGELIKTVQQVLRQTTVRA